MELLTSLVTAFVSIFRSTAKAGDAKIYANANKNNRTYLTFYSNEIDTNLEKNLSIQNAANSENIDKSKNDLIRVIGIGTAAILGLYLSGKIK